MIHTGFLSSAKRTVSGYRLYSETEIENLKKIILYRKTGLSLNEIKKLLKNENRNEITQLFVKKLGELNIAIEDIKNQQKIILEILKDKKSIEIFFSNDFESFKELGKSIGITEETARKWHENFENNSPEIHYNFLKLLGFSESEAAKIIDLSKNPNYIKS